MGNILQNDSHFKKMSDTYQKRSHLEILVTLGKMGDIWPNGSHLDNWLIGKITDTEKQVTVGKLAQALKKYFKL